jgi:hypothetical protein
MKAHLSQTQLNQIFKVQELCDKLRRKADNEDCHTYIRGYEVDREKFRDYLDCVSAAIEEMAENLLYF